MARGLLALCLIPMAGALHVVRGQVAAPSRFAGCYTVSIGLWSPGAHPRTLPSSVRLDTVPVEHGGGWRVSPTIQDSRPSAWLATSRWLMAGDDVRLTWSNGVSRTIAQLIPQSGNVLLGEIVALSDGQPEPNANAQWWTKEPPGPRAPAVLTPRECGKAAESADLPSTSPWSADLALAKRVAGCYRLVDGSWRFDSALAKIIPIPRGPTTFELTSEPDPDQTRLAALELATYFKTRSSELFSTWQRTSDKEPRILVSRPLPMAGFALNVVLRGTDLVGSIVAFSDNVGSAAHPVTARRTSCPSPRS